MSNERHVACYYVDRKPDGIPNFYSINNDVHSALEKIAVEIMPPRSTDNKLRNGINYLLLYEGSLTGVFAYIDYVAPNDFQRDNLIIQYQGDKIPLPLEKLIKDFGFIMFVPSKK